MISAYTFNGKNVTSNADRHLYWASGMRTRVYKGCAVSANENTLQLTAGFFTVFGGQVSIITDTYHTITMEATQTLKYCMLVFEVDLTNNTQAFKILESPTAYPTPTQQDLFGSGTIYQMPFAKFTQDINGISTLVDLAQRSNVMEISLPATGWTESSGVFSQTITTDTKGNTLTITSDDTVMVYDAVHTSGMTEDAWEEALDEYAILTASCWGSTGNGSITINCYEAPGIDLTIDVRGI